MAISITQLQRNAARQRASTGPSNMRPYNPSEIVPMPMPEQYRYNAQQSRRLDYGSYNLFVTPESPPYAPPTYQSHMDPSYQISIPSAVEPQLNYYESPTAFPHQPPSRTSSSHGPASTPSSPHGSQHSSSSQSSDYSRSSIEPDPLPPHSNPQALTESQCQAFSNCHRIAALRIGKDEVCSVRTGITEFRIMREDGKLVPTFVSTKPRVSVVRSSNGVGVGRIRFHSIGSSKIGLTVNGKEISLVHTGFVHNRWTFHSTTCVNEWCWKKDRQTGGNMLEESKRNGSVLARMKGDLLSFEKASLSQEQYDQIVVSAVAMTEAVRRT